MRLTETAGRSACVDEGGREVEMEVKLEAVVEEAAEEEEGEEDKEMEGDEDKVPAVDGKETKDKKVKKKKEGK